MNIAIRFLQQDIAKRSNGITRMAFFLHRQALVQYEKLLTKQEAKAILKIKVEQQRQAKRLLAQYIKDAR